MGWRILSGLVLLDVCLGCSVPDQNDIHDTTSHPLDQKLIAESQSNFETIVNTVSLPARGNRINTRFTRFSSNALLWRETSYINSQIVGYVNISYSGNIKTQGVRYEAPGDDGIWFTSDDGVYMYTDFQTTQANVNSITYDNPGPDGIWFSSDDRVRYYTVLQNNAEGSSQLMVFSISGTDTTWFTADDQIGWINYQGAIIANEQHVAVFTGPGTDADWDTVDDNLVYEHELRQFDSTGVLSRRIVYLNVGTDAIAYTPDDEVLYYNSYSYDQLGRLQQKDTYNSGPGPDGLWLSSDDPVSSCKIQLRDATDIPYRTVTQLPGSDTLCNTADDLVWGYHEDTYVNGQLSNSTAYYGSGVDNVWFTIDDIVISNREYLPAK